MHRNIWRRGIAGLGLGIGIAVGGKAQVPAMSALTMQQVAARLEQANAHRDAALASYRSRRQMTVDYQTSLGNGVAHETVDMTYVAPATKQFSIVAADGPQFIRDAVFQRALDSEAALLVPAAKAQAALTSENYDMRLLGEEQTTQGACYVLQVTPHTASPYAFVGRVWVLATEFAMVRVEAKPAQDVSLWVTAGQFTTTYARVGGFWFPSETTSTSQLRLGGTASLVIHYGPYRDVVSR